MTCEHMPISLSLTEGINRWRSYISGEELDSRGVAPKIVSIKMWVNMDIGTDIFTHGYERGFYRTDMLVYLSLRNGVSMCRIVTQVILVILVK